MKRLTEQYNGEWVTEHAEEMDYFLIRGKAIDRLAAYIELYEIVEGISRDRLREICDAERDGKLQINPCKDFMKALFETETFYIVNEAKIDEVTSSDERWFYYDGFEVVIEFNDGNDEIVAIKTSEIGKTVFLTREEAEAALGKEQTPNDRS